MKRENNANEHAKDLHATLSRLGKH